MKYELKDWKQNGNVADNGNGTSTMPIMVWTGIAGDTYGFQRTDATSFTFNNTGVDADAIKALGTEAAAAFVAKQYPNT